MGKVTLDEVKRGSNQLQEPKGSGNGNNSGI